MSLLLTSLIRHIRMNLARISMNSHFHFHEHKWDLGWEKHLARAFAFFFLVFSDLSRMKCFWCMFDTNDYSQILKTWMSFILRHWECDGILLKTLEKNVQIESGPLMLIKHWQFFIRWVFFAHFDLLCLFHSCRFDTNRFTCGSQTRIHSFLLASFACNDEAQMNVFFLHLFYARNADSFRKSTVK